jgi:hypothetical protein
MENGVTEKEKETLLKSETLILGFDDSNGTDISALSVARYNGTKLEHINIFFGEEAEWMYGRLTNKNS